MPSASFRALASPFLVTPELGLCHLSSLNLTFLLCKMCVTMLRMGPLGSGQQLCGPGPGTIGSMTTCKQEGGVLSVGVQGTPPTTLRKEIPLGRGTRGRSSRGSRARLKSPSAERPWRFHLTLLNLNLYNKGNHIWLVKLLGRIIASSPLVTASSPLIIASSPLVTASIPGSMLGSLQPQPCPLLSKSPKWWDFRTSPLSFFRLFLSLVPGSPRL